MKILEEIVQAVMDGEKTRVAELSKRALAEGTDPMTIINRGLIAGMDVVGPKFKSGEMYIPEVLQAAAAVHAGMQVVKPSIAGGKMSSRGTIVLGTVKGDLHDIGKNLVAMMLEAQGFEVWNLGIDVPVKKFVAAATEHDAQIIGLSSLLTTTMPTMREVIQVLKENGTREKYKVIVGGAPVNQSFCDSIEADGYAADAASAVDLCRKLLIE